jgi:hypothetical protein
MAVAGRFLTSLSGPARTKCGQDQTSTAIASLTVVAGAGASNYHSHKINSAAMNRLARQVLDISEAQVSQDITQEQWTRAPLFMRVMCGITTGLLTRHGHSASQRLICQLEQADHMATCVLH